MNTGKAIVISSVLLLALGASANAQDAPNPLFPVAGTREISVSGNLNFEPDDNYNINVGYGPFLTPQIQVGGRLGFARTDTVTNANYAAFGNYHFSNPSAYLPYVGLTVGGNTQKISGQGSDTSFTLGAQAGVKYFLNSSVAISPELVYTNPTDEGVKDTFSLRLGISVFLR